MRAAVAVIALYHILGRQPATAPRCDPKPKLIILTDGVLKETCRYLIITN